MDFLLSHALEIGAAAAALVIGAVAIGIANQRRSEREMRMPGEILRRDGIRVRPMEPDDPPSPDPRRERELDRTPEFRRERDADLLPARPMTPFASAHHPRAAAHADSGPVSAEVVKLTEQVAALEQRLDTGLGRLEGRVRDLEQRADGAADTGGYASPEAREVERLFTAAPRPEPRYGGMGDAVVSQSLPLSGGVDGIGGLEGGGIAGGGGERIAVELSGTEVLVTQSIPPEAWLVPRGGGRAQVSLNPEVPHNRFALDRLATFFDLGDRREGAYTTRAAAEVRWDEAERRGVLLTPGKAVAR